MSLEDKIYFIDDILDEYEKRGGDREAAEALYWTTREELVENISTTDGVVYKIDNFGNLYYPLSSLHNLINKVDKVIWTQEEPKNQGAWSYMLTELLQLIDKLKQSNKCGINFMDNLIEYYEQNETAEQVKELIKEIL